jgi:hemin uptake protein HemP
MSERSIPSGAAHAEPACASSKDAELSRPAPTPSDAILRGRKIVEIAHNGEVYRLQATRLGKLILTK